MRASFFVSASDLDWEPILKAWLNKCDPVHHPDMLQEHFAKLPGPLPSLRDCGLAFEWLLGELQRAHFLRQ